MMKTRDTSTWAVRLHSANMIDATFNFENPDTYIVYDPQFPYLYLPEKDFLTYLGLASRFYSNRDLNCNYSHRGSCFFDAPCSTVASEYTKTNLYLSLGDNE